jgi:hypothetical protein
MSRTLLHGRQQNIFNERGGGEEKTGNGVELFGRCDLIGYQKNTVSSGLKSVSSTY